MNLFARLTLAAALAAGAVAAQASVVTAEQTVALQSGTNANTLTAGFSTVHTVAGEFVDTFTFTGWNFQSWVNGSLTTIGSTAMLDIDFVTATLNGVSYKFSVTPMGRNPDGIEQGNLANFATNGPLVLTVHGYAGSGLAAGTAINASYSGTVNVTKIPEPASMALAGLGLLGVIGVRRKAAKAAAVKA
ncbi:FxDxF family PEP-CTERM protein [Roseateles chitosanitabidus]|jgi:hypothetical protein|uniref:FxDxF family PEP-CTERM protein n=1 Tax=Roseateles chitosanitabidus TaxID=65048 RepID=UPI000836F582|nr:FxDxF family PEP-CTERM protein [Roseateles chitosanitabidus]MBO9689507.1 PEP-CTERM sorting domain-containing protein [Roseateles chitosanitabidus]